MARTLSEIEAEIYETEAKQLWLREEASDLDLVLDALYDEKREARGD